MNRKNILEQLKNFKTDETKALWMMERINEIENDVEAYKDKLSDATAKTINDIIEEDLEFPEKVLKYAATGEFYQDLIDQFKIRMAIDDGLVNEEARELLREAKQTILNLRSNIAKAKASTKCVREDLKIMSKQLYIHKKLDEVKTDTAKKRVKRLLLESETIDSMTEYEIDRKIAEIIKD